MISTRSNLSFLVVIATVMTSLVVSAASTWYVSPSGNDSNSGKMETSAFKTIQKAIDSAAAKDTVLVKEGTYSRITIPKSKAGLIVRAVGNAEKTIINGPGRCVTIADGTVTNIYVEGFTLTGGWLGSRGMDGAGALGGTYNNCIITGNSCSTDAGGAKYCTLNGCTISNNSCSDWHGGIEYCIASNCVISGNKSTGVGAGGAKSSILIECKITNNSGGSGGGGADSCTLYRCLFSGNTRTQSELPGKDINGGTAYDCVIKANKGSRTIVAAKCYNCTIVSTAGNPSIWRDTILYNCIISSTGNTFGINGDYNWGVKMYNCLLNNVSLGSYTTKSGCVTADPKFVSASDFNLQNSSPCINKGNNSYVSTTKDYLGKPRIMDGKVDIGACEYQPPVFSVETVSAVQRYPWNGLVEVQFKVTEANNNTGLVTLSAKDVIGNTNLPVKAIYKSNGTVANMTGEPISPGSYKWVWNATEDLPKNFKCERVTVSVKVANETGTSGEFRMDLSGMGPWEMRTAWASEAISYSSTWATNALADSKAVVKVYPVKREKPKYIAIDLSGGTAATHYPIEYLDEIPGGIWSDEYKTSKLVLRHIPAGSFIMGGRNTDYPGAVNTNLHMVTLTRDFYMGVFEVTQRQWELVMGNRPSAFSNEMYYATRPVECVSYADIRGGVKGITWPVSKEVDEGSFMERIRSKTIMAGFDLPTEAQWEYACRAGTTTALNSGKNVTTLSELCPNVNEVARYIKNNDERTVHLACYTATRFSTDTTAGTASVGTYKPNSYGFYDMLGNVYELCLDLSDIQETGSIDPIGEYNSTDGSRQLRGGSWSSGAHIVISGFHRNNDVPGFIVTKMTGNVGFRLCLQGGEIPEAAEGVQLVNAAGEGTANWTPTKAGTYYLTHETQTNGVNGAEVLGAWFTVDAPKLTFVPDGDLTPGVKVAIAGAGDGWTVRYELSGNENGGVGTRCPTSESPEYTEPITLNESATIRAMAFSDGGLESLEYAATFSLMSVGGAVARPRYPWSGKVDIDVTVKGSENEDYLVSLVARDLDGGTNLPLRTAWQAGGTVTNNAFLVKSGTHRFTWDAVADITNDCEFANVVVNVSAEHNAIIAAKKVLTLEVAGYAGSETLTNVPVLVRLSTSINGFSYADFVDAKGGDLIFTDESGSIVYPHEIDEWHTDGESLVWVKLPQMVNGTKFKMAYGNAQLITHNSQLSSHEVWRDYAGVWHMNEDSGTAFDSTEHGLDALPSCGTNKLADVSQMVAYENGACGRARVNGTNAGVAGNYMTVPSYDALSLGFGFSVSFWVRAEEVEGCPRLVSRKHYCDDVGGWEIAMRQSSISNLVLGAENSTKYPDHYLACPSVVGGWVGFAFVFSENVVSCYTNGILSKVLSIDSATDNGEGLAFGNTPNAFRERSLHGQYDEIRLRGGSLSADRIKADYDMIVNRNFLRYGPVDNGKGEAE